MRRPEECVGPPVARVTDVCEPPDVGVRNEIQFTKALGLKPLSHKA